MKELATKEDDSVIGINALYRMDVDGEASVIGIEALRKMNEVGVPDAEDMERVDEIAINNGNKRIRNSDDDEEVDDNQVNY